MNELAMQHRAIAAARSPSIPKAGFLDTVMAAADVLFPTLAKGVIMRRPGVMAVAQRFDLDRRAIHRMQMLRDRYREGPLRLRIPGREIALILEPRHVHRILGQTPEPFATATKEKVAALAHFEPKGVLISKGEDREDRRRFNEAALDTGRPVHRLSESFGPVIMEEARRLIVGLGLGGELNWANFSDAWFRMVRQVIFGSAARDDQEISYLMSRLRSAANWAFLAPQRPQLRQRLMQRIREYLVQADPESLAGAMAHLPSTQRTAPEQQVPQWLFAFDAAGMATFRSLALLATHPEHRKTSLRAVVLEALRLWPTTPLVLRESEEATEWETGQMPAHTAIVIYAPFFHRDSERVPFADSFVPGIWVNGEAQKWPFIPFSEGPATCPGRELVLLLSSAMLTQLLTNADYRLKAPASLQPGQPLPATLNHFGLRFAVRP